MGKPAISKQAQSALYSPLNPPTLEDFERGSLQNWGAEGGKIIPLPSDAIALTNSIAESMPVSQRVTVAAMSTPDNKMYRDAIAVATGSADEDWLNVEVSATEYLESSLQRLLRWLDQLLVWLEKGWQWLRSRFQ